MKQLACFLTAGAMLLTLCACSGSPASSPSPDPTPSSPCHKKKSRILPMPFCEPRS